MGAQTPQTSPSSPCRDALLVAAGVGAAGLALLAWRALSCGSPPGPPPDDDDDDDDPTPLGDPSLTADPELAPLLREARRRARRALLGRARAPLPGVLAAVGGTPLLRVASLSEATGCEIVAKAELLEPGGSVKDRVAVSIVREAVAAGRLALPRRGAGRTGGLMSEDDEDEGEDGGDGSGPAVLRSSPLPPSPLLTEGTAGSTGVSLALVAAASGCRCFVALPDDAALEKSRLLRALGADVARLRPVAIAHPEHPVRVAARRAAAEQGQEGGAALFADQFENPANWRAHLQTGEEIWMQAEGARGAAALAASSSSSAAAAAAAAAASCSHLHPPPPPPPRIDAFVSGAGTGGTLAGASLALKARDARARAVLVDVAGSSLYNRVARGVAYDPREAEGTRLRHPFDTVAEGVGLNRVTANFARARVDGAVRCSDAEAVRMAAHVLRHDGLFVGSSAAVNLVGAVKVARAFRRRQEEQREVLMREAGGAAGGGGQASSSPLPPLPRPVVATLLCDGGARHLTKFHCPEYLATLGLDVGGGERLWGRTDLSWVGE
jgi:cysteine synthase A